MLTRETKVEGQVSGNKNGTKGEGRGPPNLLERALLGRGAPRRWNWRARLRPIQLVAAAFVVFWRGGVCLGLGLGLSMIGRMLGQFIER